MFFFPIRQHLRPFISKTIPENPATIIFYFKNEYANISWHYYIYLSVSSFMWYIHVVENSILWYSTFYKAINQISL